MAILNNASINIDVYVSSWISIFIFFGYITKGGIVGWWELNHKEGWAPNNWSSWTVVLEKTLKSPLDCKEIKPVNPEGNQP